MNAGADQITESGQQSLALQPLHVEATQQLDLLGTRNRRESRMHESTKARKHEKKNQQLVISCCRSSFVLS
jgi:hypothetical protein